VIGHEGTTLLCLKVTSRVTLYQNDPELMAGCVYYRGREVPCFTTDTAIQPDNPFLIAYRDVQRAEQVLGLLPNDFHGRLVRAIRACIRLTPRQRRKLLERIDEHGG
jgi:hypothetical protein